MVSCYKCSRSISKDTVTCRTCAKSFHPSCVGYYLKTRAASDCCSSLASSSAESAGGSAAGPPTGSSQTSVLVSASAALSQASALVDSLPVLSQASAGLSRPAVSGDIQRSFSMENFVLLLDSRLLLLKSDLVSIIDDRLGPVGELAAELRELGERQAVLEGRIDGLSGAVKDCEAAISGLRSELVTPRSVPPSRQVDCEVIFSGLPSDAPGDGLALVRELLASMSVPDLAPHVIAVRRVAGARRRAVEGEGSSSASSTASLIAACSSPAVR
ncbi:hypothetical protein ABEB36_015088 [Hypothenemus hampei]|uniref:Phorbol-ester/DAG-type domain-containing protein n=1 Tax=Hypothenemus hampei TaxID=57062 RepID=A0ABD1E0M5_HYPHA